MITHAATSPRATARPSLSVIVTTYERPAHLRRSLEGIRQQSGADFEVIVADDGSGPETAEVIEAFGRSVPFRVAHVWQENKGFRAARMRNLGIQASRGERIVFLDGDCVPLPGFLRVHGEASGTDRVLAGTRLFLDREPTESLRVEDVAAGAVSGRIPNDQWRTVHWTAAKNIFYRHVLRKERPRVVTANLSVSRRALDAVNGLDERFVGWGKEDDDLRRRLVRRGFPLESVYTRALACHLWHPMVESFPGRVRDTPNIGYYERGFYLSRCLHGLRTRPLEGCRIAWNETLPAGRSCEVSVGWGPRPRWSPAEIRVFVSPDGSAPRSHAHLTLAVEGSPPERGTILEALASAI